jgi:hypothetical protein
MTVWACSLMRAIVRGVAKRRQQPGIRVSFLSATPAALAGRCKRRVWVGKTVPATRPRASHERATNEPRTSRERAANEPRAPASGSSGSRAGTAHQAVGWCTAHQSARAHHACPITSRERQRAVAARALARPCSKAKDGYSGSGSYLKPRASRECGASRVGRSAIPRVPPGRRFARAAHVSRRVHVADVADAVHHVLNTSRALSHSLTHKRRRRAITQNARISNAACASKGWRLMEVAAGPT